MWPRSRPLGSRGVPPSIRVLTRASKTHKNNVNNRRRRNELRHCDFPWHYPVSQTQLTGDTTFSTTLEARTAVNRLSLFTLIAAVAFKLCKTFHKLGPGSSAWPLQRYNNTDNRSEHLSVYIAALKYMHMCTRNVMREGLDGYHES